ncbi:NAD(P)-binding protein [Haliea sp. E1-2-M8]|uniref:NAD(P)-binding protein n=1 Tax=Haliea sp. E1-2-M8 TaxID=3064706 RepID=UPI0027233B2E|nr:NAD(P)-binding protein [Haliea sp. E1-2-M8]MDO8860125.1 NAD(P)-binding protein [Haliea sp. E1-2-M8]
MDAVITRRDLIHDAGMAALAMALCPSIVAAAPEKPAPAASSPSAADYPPVRTGMRGSHPGAFESAHALAREGRSFPEPVDLDQHFDLVIVGAGISGLAAARFYQQRFGADRRILLLENHDDFGGHARRNEFHQAGRMVLSMGGTHNLEWWDFSATVQEFLKDHGVDVDLMRERKQFHYGDTAPNSPAMWFDAATYGENRLVVNCDLTARLDSTTIDQMPISEAGRESFKHFYAAREDLLEHLDEAQAEDYLRSISYPEFLRRHGGLTEDAVQLFAKLEHGGWGVEMRALSAQEAMESGFPGVHLLGGSWDGEGWDYPVAMWPDGNASLARLQVATLIPGVAPGTTAANVAVARFNYAELDRPGNPVRLRLNSTVINTANTEDGVAVSYINDGKVLRVTAGHCVLACYHSIIPHLCPELPQSQREALEYQVKHPLLLTNVLIRNTDALDTLGIDGVRCPGRLMERLFTFRGINTGGYEHAIDDSGPVALVFWGSISPPADAVDIKSQLRASRAIMLGMSFEDYEREVRTVLDGLLGPAGFDVRRDILAITVNRWPHGYAYEYLDLWDPDWPEDEAPHEIARKPFGRIAIANTDAAATAYTHTAIEQAWRAVQGLPTRRPAGFSEDPGQP